MRTCLPACLPAHAPECLDVYFLTPAFPLDHSQIYFILNAENYRWQWISFLASGSTAFYVFLYSIYYFFWKTKMSGFLQVSFYFGYMGLFCMGFCILCGTMGVAGASVFVRRIYQNIKVD